MIGSDFVYTTISIFQQKQQQIGCIYLFAQAAYIHSCFRLLSIVAIAIDLSEFFFVLYSVGILQTEYFLQKYNERSMDITILYILTYVYVYTIYNISIHLQLMSNEVLEYWLFDILRVFPFTRFTCFFAFNFRFSAGHVALTAQRGVSGSRLRCAASPSLSLSPSTSTSLQDANENVAGQYDYYCCASRF